MTNIASLLQSQLATPDRILYRHYLEGGWRELSARDIAAYAARWQAYLRGQGFSSGERIALCLKNGIHWVAADQAALGLGLVVADPGGAHRLHRCRTRQRVRSRRRSAAEGGARILGG